MTDTLKQRLDALSQAEVSAILELKNSTDKTDEELGSWLSSTASQSAALRNAYRSGDLVTKEELEAAVEAEREACAAICDSYASGHANIAQDLNGDGAPSLEEVRARAKGFAGLHCAQHIRARGEDQG